ncbi:probable methyltransferase TARBP1 [Bacillus rossius redtenbacheri]|uniref:probable methyltransferase TARBP1 n=1 Tax=Bacillus rossius redtenbacheri TaxID=93214 RepID=UPI002FDEDA44
MCVKNLTRECDVWRIDEIVEILHKIGIDELLTSNNVLFTNIIASNLARKTCDFSDSSLKQLNELKFLLMLRLKLRGNEYLPGSEDLVKFCCDSLRSQICDEIRSHFSLLSDILVKGLLLSKQNAVVLDLLQESSCNIVNCFSVLGLSLGETELLHVSKYTNSILANSVILESVVEFYRLASNTDIMKHEEVCKILDEDCLCEAVLKLATCGLKDVVVHTLTSLVPKLADFNQSIFSHIWSEISMSVKHNPTDSTKTMWNLFNICTLADYYFPSNINDRFVSLISSDVLWKLLQEGLVHDDSTVRKQAIYVMKRTIDIVMRHKLVIDADNDKLTVFCWQPSSQDELVSMWEKYFIVLETLEETQVHLVTPVLRVVDELIQKFIAESIFGIKHVGLHITWVVCIFHRILYHENSSIKKWGVVAMDRHKFNFVSDDNECASKVVITLIQALNDSALYSCTQGEYSAVNLKVAVQGVLTSVSKLSPQKAQDVFVDILKVTNTVQWDPVSLFYFCHSLACIPGTETKVLNRLSVYLFEDFVRNSLANQNVFIRGGVQCFLILALTNLLDSNDVGLPAIANILGCFRSSESLKRGTYAWNSVVEWLKTFVDTDLVQNFRVEMLASLTSRECNDNRIKESCLARMMVLFWDAECMPFPFYGESSPIEEHLLRLIDSFRDTDRRLYANAMMQETCLKFLISLLEESEQLRPLPVDQVRNTVLALARLCIPGVLVFILRKLASVSDFADYDVANFLVKALKTFSKGPELFPLICKEVEVLQTTAMGVFFRNNPHIRRYFASHVLVWALEVIQASSENAHWKEMLLGQHEQFLLKIVDEGMLNYSPVKDEGTAELARNSNASWGRVASSYLRNIWSLLAAFLQVERNHSKLVACATAASIFDAALECVQLGGKDILPQVLAVVGHFLDSTTSESLESASEVLSLCWKTMFELRKTEMFWHAFKAFVAAAFTESVLRNPLLQPVTVQYARNILDHGENVSKLPYVLLQQLNKEVQCTSVHFLDPFVDILAEALVFGPVHRRDLRMVNDTCDYIESLGVQLSVNELLESDCQANNKVRALAVGLLLRLVSSPDGHQTAFRVLDYLREKDRVASSRKPFYHKDSQLHRLKHRVLQVLLILEPILSLARSEGVAAWLSACLLSDSPQPSVRYQQEWLLILILLRHPQLHGSLWDATRQALETRTGSMCSFVSVLFHVARCSPADQEQLVDRTVRETLPCTMAHHFVVRTYAKVTIIKLLKLCEEKQFDHLVSKYSVVKKALKLQLEQGNAVKALEKLLDEFYFTIFSPVHHYTIETIFYDLPRLANVTQEEWIPVSLFESLPHFSASTIPLKNVDSRLSNFSAADWIVKSTAQDESSGVVQTQVTLQKKVVAWRGTAPGQEEDGGRGRAGDGLVVVASLVDRPPNLGGLSRTCEVFGASRYVLGSLRYAEDKQFQNLSVNADKWISMLEVKPHMLPQYILSMKQDGYLIVGIEQTANSTKLDKMKFPKKSLLLLGNEKQGIPANLLPLMDVCVEVPQRGLTRSLNVHVTGAICIWEYYQQHMLTERPCT